MAKATHAQKKEEEIIDRTAPGGEIVYEAIYAEGEHELTRHSAELALSGLAAGLSMGFSMVSEALLQFHLPEARWTPLITKLGYSVGFLIVILGRQQLFTKNTLTVILPLLKRKKISIVGKVARLWAIVLCTNLIGAFVFAWMLGHSNIFEEDVRAIFAKIGQAAIQPDFLTLVLRGALAGWLIALMVWLFAVRRIGSDMGNHHSRLRRRCGESAPRRRGQCRNILPGHDWRIVLCRLLHEIFASDVDWKRHRRGRTCRRRRARRVLRSH